MFCLRAEAIKLEEQLEPDQALPFVYTLCLRLKLIVTDSAPEEVMSMFRMFLHKLRFLQMLAKNGNGDSERNSSMKLNLSGRIETDLASLQNLFGSSSDVIIRRFTIGTKGATEAAIIYIDGLVDRKVINDSILRPLMVDTKKMNGNGAGIFGDMIEAVEFELLTVGDVKRKRTFADVVDGVLLGDTALLVQGAKDAFIISSRGEENRGVQEPETEVVVRGPREGFSEVLRINTSLLRRKIRNANLIIDTVRLGERTRTNVCIAYLKGVTNDRLVEEIKRRLKDIRTDAILDSGYIEQFIEDAPFSPFSTIGNTEKPDVTAAKVLEGRAAIMVDGTPMALTVPKLFIESFQSGEDYYSRPFYSTLVRWFRYLAFATSVLMPAIYVALTTFHQELVPTPLLITMAAAREGTPFPAMVDVITMGIIFEILREAGVRLPRAVGQAVSIVGALVIGQAAVSAGLIGAPVVIVVALTAIATFVVPPLVDAAAILRLVFTLLAGSMGGFGVIIGLLATLVHLASLRSFGTPFLSPLAPLSVSDLKDVLVRAPLWAMITRPRLIGWRDPQRQEFQLAPAPPDSPEQAGEKRKR